MKFRTCTILFASAGLFASFGVASAQVSSGPVPIQIPVPPAPAKAQGVPRSTNFVFVGSPALKAGDAAPSLKGARWVKGNDSLNFSDGKVHVVAFWSTWCEPCRQTLPFLGDLARQFRGKADFVAVNVKESTDDVASGRYVSKVATYTREMGANMAYPVAVDDARGTIAKAWLDASARDVPVAFVVDRQGRIAWAGHPMGDLEDVLGRVVKGQFDAAKAKERYQVRLMVEGTVREALAPIQFALKADKPDEVVKAIDKAIAANPELESGFGPMKFHMLLKSDEAKAFAFAKKLGEGSMKSNPQMLNVLAWTIVDDNNGLKKPDFALAISLARRASELVDNRDPFILDTLAYALFKDGKRPEALKLQEKAMQLVERMEIPSKTLEEMRARFELFRKLEPLHKKD